MSTKRGGVTLKETGKARTKREVLQGNFQDTTFCTSLDWPADIYVLAKAVAAKRGVPLNELAFEAMRQYLVASEELAGLGLGGEA